MHKWFQHWGMEIKRSRIFCWIATSPTSLTERAKSVNTWGKRCDVLLFFSSKVDSRFPAIGLNVEEGKKKALVNKTRALHLSTPYARR